MSPAAAPLWLPGLLFLAAAAATTFLLTRFFDPAPKWVLLLFAGLVLSLVGPALFGGRILLPLDLLRTVAPFGGLEPTRPPGNFLQVDLLQLTAPLAAEVHRAAQAGRWPLLAAQAGAGMPLLADPHAQALQPLAFAAWLLEPWEAAGVTAALRLYLALLFTFLFLARQGLSAGSALFGAVAWGLGGFLQLWLGWPHANSATLLPAVLWAVARVCDEGARRDRALLAGCLAALLLAGHPETVLYATGLAAAFALARLAALPRGRRARVLGRLALPAVVAAGLAAPALLPAAHALPGSFRAVTIRSGPPAQPVADGAGRRAELRLVPVVAPNAFGNDRFGAFWGEGNVNEAASGFVGTAGLLAALLALVARRRARRPQELFFVAATALALAVVGQVPGVVDLLSVVRAGTISAFHHRLLLVAGFGLAYLAACEVDRWSLFEARPRRGALLAVGLGAGLVWAYASHPPPPGLEVFRLQEVRWLVVQLVTLGAAVALVALGRGRRWLPAALVAVAVLELLYVHRPANPAAPSRLRAPLPPALAFVVGREDGARLVAEDSALLPNLATLYGLADVRVYNPLTPATYVALIEPLRTGWWGELALLGSFDHPLYDLLGVRWVLARPGSAPPPGLSVAFTDGTGQVWKRPGPRSLLFLPGAATQAPAAWPQAVAGIGDFSAWALVDGLPGGLPWKASGPASLALDRRSAAWVRARVPAAEDRLVASSLFQDGGWRVVLAERRRPALLTNGVFAGAWVNGGVDRVDFVYRPPGFLPGLLAAAVGLLLAAAFWVAPPARPRSFSPRL